MLPATNPSRTARRLLKRFLYSQFGLRDALMIALGKEQPRIAFTVEAEPSSVYFNFRIPPESLEEFARYINLADGLAPVPISCVKGEEPDFLLTLNVYEVSGIVSGLRAEWSTYVADAEGVSRYMVLEAQCSEGSLDPVNLFTRKGRVEHSMTRTAIETLVAAEGGALFRAQLQLHDEHPMVEIATEWIVANDYIYWRNGICDRTYYDANMIAAPVRTIPAADVQIDDQTYWARFVEPAPKHVLKYDGPLHFMIIPWANV